MLKMSGGDFHDKLLKVPTLRPALGRGLKIQTQIPPHSCWQEVRRDIQALVRPEHEDCPETRGAQRRREIDLPGPAEVRLSEP